MLIKIHYRPHESDDALALNRLLISMKAGKVRLDPTMELLYGIKRK